MPLMDSVKIEGREGANAPLVSSRELSMEQWIKGPHFTAEGLAICVLQIDGLCPLATVSAKAGSFYYAEKLKGATPDALEPDSQWFIGFLERAKLKKLRQEALLGAQRSSITRIALPR